MKRTAIRPLTWALLSSVWVCPVLCAAQTPDPFSRLGFHSVIANEGDAFGSSIATSGVRVAIGAPGATSVESITLTPVPFAGLVGIYEPTALLDFRIPTSSLGMELVVALDPAQGDLFGASVAIEGDSLFVGAPGTVDGSSGLRTGSVYVYAPPALPGDVFWVQLQKITPPVGVDGEDFGFALALDDDRLLIGAPGGANPSGGGHPGIVYVYERDTAGTWIYMDRFTSGKAYSGGRFGRCLEFQGDELFVGAPREGVPMVFTEIALVGAVYRFVETSPNAWVQKSRIVAPTTNALSFFGDALAVSGNTLAVGSFSAQAPTIIPGSVGKVLLFVRDDKSTASILDDKFRHAQSLQPSTLTTGNYFGKSVDIEGNLLLIGAPFGEFAASPPGSAFMFERKAGTWHLTRELESPEQLVCCGVSGGTSSGAIANRFGFRVLISHRDGETDQGLFITSVKGDTGLFTGMCFDTNAVFGIDPQFVPCNPANPGPGLAPLSLISGSAYRYRRTQNVSVRSIPLQLGGSQVISIDSGPAAAGLIYAVFGSVTGVSPAQPFGSMVLPLQFDPYSTLVASRLNSSYFNNFLGSLDSMGRATATLTFGPLTDPALANLIFYHSTIIYDAISGEATLGTNPTELQLVP